MKQTELNCIDCSEKFLAGQKNAKYCYRCKDKRIHNSKLKTRCEVCNQMPHARLCNNNPEKKFNELIDSGGSFGVIGSKTGGHWG